jgi:protein ImuB
MRLASIYVPALPLQVEVGEHPELLGRALVVVGGDPEVVACSRAAFDAGIRPGMSPSQARTRVADLAVAIGSPARWRAALIDLAEEIAALLPEGQDRRIDLSEALRGDGVATHPALFLVVPAGQRSDRFGRILLDLAAARGLRVRVGIAADRFTARAAARTRRDSPVVVVPRGGAAEFLAPLPLDLLPLRDEVRALLHAAGIRTLGQFAALPPPSVGRAAGAVDYQELARGNGPSHIAAGPIAGPARERRPALPAPRRARRSSGSPANDRQLHLAG